ncbi:MAG: hypothetical protein QOG68_1518 [Solirubrobacteraceae bacterium]|jgi:hypothetical protein|nr:hypothetical protein [Solirubrobacteraceae bacterium]
MRKTQIAVSFTALALLILPVVEAAGRGSIH